LGIGKKYHVEKEDQKQDLWCTTRYECKKLLSNPIARVPIAYCLIY